MAPRNAGLRALAAALPAVLVLAVFGVFGVAQTAEASAAPQPRIERAAVQDEPRQEQPRRDNDGGARITWKGVLIPLLVALAIIFAVGLFLMRIWHWIDPT